ncbi:hypothetical protein [Sodalis ligni]
MKESDEVFKSQGEEEYRRFQEAHLNQALPQGLPFPSLNDYFP